MEWSACLSESIGPRVAHHGVLHFAGGLAVLFHRGIVALPIEGQVVLGGERFEQLGRDAVGLVQLGRDGAVDGDAVVAAHLVEDAVDVVEAGVDRAEEVFFFLFDDAADALDGFAELGIRPLHHLGDFGHELVRNGSRRPIWWPSSTARRSRRLTTYFSLFAPG